MGSAESFARRSQDHAQPLSEIANLLPTPVADHSRGLAQPDTDSQSLPNVAISLLPTPTVMDMGANYTPEEWQAWKDKQRAAHSNGNGHGASLTQEAISLLPTPRAQLGEDVNNQPYHRTYKGKRMLSNLENRIADVIDPTMENLPHSGAATPPRFDAGSPSSDDPHLLPLFPAPTDAHA